MKRILLVADEKGWVFESHCLQIKKRLTQYVIDIAYHRQNVKELSNDYDLIYILDPMPLPHGYPPPSKVILGLRNEFLYQEHPKGPKGLFFDGFDGRCVSLNRCSILHVVNKNQYAIFRDIVLPICPLFLAQHGIDENVFDKNKYIKTPNNALIVGVSGRDSSNKSFGLVKAACDRAGVKFLSAQYGCHKVPKDKMPEFYNKIDVYVCMSKSEGQNNPLMEAGGMGVPLISTDSGAAKEIIEDGDNGLLIERNVDALVIALEKLKDPELRQSMGQKIHQEIMTNWTWKERIRDFENMFKFYFIQQHFGNGKWGSNY